MLHEAYTQTCSKLVQQGHRCHADGDVLTETPAVTKSRLSLGLRKRLKKPVEKLRARCIHGW